jgi:hypothetical protein
MQSTALFDRQTVAVEIAFQNEDDFVRNLACLRGELRSGLAMPVPSGVLLGTLPTGTVTRSAGESAPQHGAHSPTVATSKQK